MNIQIFGFRNDSETRKALRFFSDRRVKTQFVDLKEKPASKGELRGFVDRFGIDAILDRSSKRFHELGLQSAHYGADRWLEILVDEPALLKTPLTRKKPRVAVGYSPDDWKSWLDEG